MVVVEDVPKAVGSVGSMAISRGIRDEVAPTRTVSLGAGAVVAADSCASVMVGACQAAEGGTAGWLSPVAVG